MAWAWQYARMINTPYVLFLGDAPDPLSAKLAQGIKDWRPEASIGQIRLKDCHADMGLPDMTPRAAADAGAQTLVIGVANRGGVISKTWMDTLVEGLEAGLDIASGLHNLLRNEERLVQAAHANGRELHDVRLPTGTYPIADGKPRSGLRCLAVGSDCSVGKMYTMLALEKEMHKRQLKASFRATGQTGILITGKGVPLDAVVADFMAGAVEQLTPNNDPDHWDLIEGQGSLFHISYSGVSLALIHGGAPDALVVCHEPTRKHMRGLPEYPLPQLEDVRDSALSMARVVNPHCQVVGISVNTAGMSEDESGAYLVDVEQRMQLPCIDPFRYGAGRLVDALQDCQARRV